MDITENLIISAENGDLEGVRRAISEGALVNARGPNSFALHCAAFGGHSSVVSYLIDSGASLDLSDAQGFYALHLAASKGHVETAQMLLNANAPVDAVTPAGGTALHIAIASGYDSLVPLLLKAGADVNAKDNKGHTPLMTAVGANSLASVKVLMAAGANVDVLDNQQETALWLALGNAYSLRIPSWETRGMNGKRSVSYTIGAGLLRYNGRILPLKEQLQIAGMSWIHGSYPRYLKATDIVLELLSHAPKLGITGSDWSELHFAASLGEPRIIKAILALKPDLKARTKDGALAIHLAASSQRPDGLKVLTKPFKAHINTGDSYGWTPLHYICDKGGPAEMFEILFSAAADLQAQTSVARGDLSAGILPIDVARHWKDFEVVELLNNHLVTVSTS